MTWKYSIKALLALTAFLVTFQVQDSQGKILFDGYAKILVDSQPAGYLIQRYEHDPKKKELISKYYIQTSKILGEAQESLVAKCREDFQPLSYRHTHTQSGHTRQIQAKFQKGFMSGSISQGSQSKKFRKKIPQGTFLSTFLNPLMHSRGYKKGVQFTFSAISEEDGKIFQGEAYVKGPTSIGRLKAFQVLNKFKGIQFVSFVSPQKGDVLGTRSPLQKISTEITRFEVATRGYPLNRKALKALFGEVPRGTKNIYVQSLLSQRTGRF